MLVFQICLILAACVFGFYLVTIKTKVDREERMRPPLDYKAFGVINIGDVQPFLEKAEHKFEFGFQIQNLMDEFGRSLPNNLRETRHHVTYKNKPAQLDFGGYAQGVAEAYVYVLTDDRDLAHALQTELARIEISDEAEPKPVPVTPMQNHSSAAPVSEGYESDKVSKSAPSRDPEANGQERLAIDPRWNKAHYARVGPPLARSPKAIVWDSAQIGDVFAARPDYNLKPIDHIQALDGLPVWFDFPPESHRPETYEIFWGIDPMGEYLYYLAGDFRKSKKGCLGYDEAKTFFRVETCFETDVIDVSKHDDVMYQGWADTSAIDAAPLMPRTIGDILSPYPASTHPYESCIAYITLGPFLSDFNGQARMMFNKSANGNFQDISLVFESYRSPQQAGEYERLTRIKAKSSDADLELQSLFDHFKVLVAEYHDMPYVTVSGSMRY